MLTILIVVASVATAVALMMLVRRRAPIGSYFEDSDRAGAILGFIGTAFSVLLAFVIFLALETYTGAKTEASHEADALLEQFEIAALFSPEDRDVLRSQLVCYGRGVVVDEWPAMRSGGRSTDVDERVLAIESAIDGVNVEGVKQETAFAKFFDETTEREDGRRGRLTEAEGVVPSPMWLILILGSGCLLGYMLLFADRRSFRLRMCSPSPKSRIGT